ncbi:MAG: hypothetical protein KC475_00830 [Cyanobacteria bacterium HKST-UBA03]|nr:hypothetical protein [Cyanobacteria bacterium HKST-UBA03]
MKIPAIQFGLLTVINPTLRQRVEKELRRGDGRQTPVIEGLAKMRGDQRIEYGCFKPGYESLDGGMYPNIDDHARVGLFPLPHGWGLVASNDKARCSDERVYSEIMPPDDMNHLLRMLSHRLRRTGETLSVEDTVSAYLAHEEKRSAAGAKPPIGKFEQTA